MTHAQTELSTTEAVLLAHGLLARLAEQVGARVLFVKGPTAVAAGARPPRGSSDVDVLVDPRSFAAVCEAIDGLGWTRRFVESPLPHTADVAFEHSAHFIHEEWPCDLDVHYLFPGFLAEPSAVFDALWAARVETEIAGVLVPTPDLAGHALVVGLHALRDPSKPVSQADLTHLIAVIGQSLDNAGRAHLRDLAIATGSHDSARTMLEAAGLTGLPPAIASPELTAWQFRQEFGGVSGSLWMIELRRASWRERPRVVAHAIVPPRELLLSPHLASSATRREIAILHGRRWLRGLRALPRALPALRRAPSSAGR